MLRRDSIGQLVLLSVALGSIALGCGSRSTLEAFVVVPVSSDVGPSGPSHPSGGAATDGGGAAWSPNAMRARLAFWFDPTSMIQAAGKVAKWSDLSGNGNDAVQSIALYEPAYDASGIGGLPSAMFNGPVTFLSIADGPTMQWGTGDFVVLAVVRATAQTAPEAMLYQKTGPYPWDGVNLYINADKPYPTSLAAAQVTGAVFVVSSPPPSTFVDSSVHVLGARRTGTALEIRVDGAVSTSITNASVATVNASAAGWAAVIGQNGYGTPRAEFQQVHGDVAEMLGVAGALTQAELANLEAYLKARYGIR